MSQQELPRHQIFGLRTFISDGKNKTTHKYFAGCDFDDLKDVFKNPQAYLTGIPSDERFNIYFTIAKCAGERELRSQKHIPFDIDAIDVGRAKETVQAACKALGISFDKTLSLFSGNGVQFHVELIEAFEDPNYFDEQRIFYKACSDRINRYLAEAGLPGHCDTSVFSTARIMRMPGTLNRKPDKPPRMAEVINANSTPIKFDLQEASGLPRIEREDQLAKYPPPDTQAVLEGCLNIREMLERPDSIAEPLWYACASVIGNLGGNAAEGRRLWHEYSSKYKKYVAAEADRKLDQALAASGPRTCASFAGLTGSKCDSCPHYKKIRSPILITGPDYIRTRDSGFYNITVNKDGGISKKPNYKDLFKYFNQIHPFVINAESGGIFVFNKTHYEPYPELMLHGFAEDNFESCDNRKAGEFSKLIRRKNQKYASWFADTTEYKMNFQNGVLDVRTGKFDAGPQRDLGFMFTLDFDYDANAAAPVFEKFLNEVTCGDTELRQVLLEFGGYALSNDKYWAHKALLLLGDGSNGKNTYMTVLKNIAGEGYSAVAMRNLTNEQYIANLEGKLFNISEETSVKAFQDTDAFKTICSGGEIMVKTVYEKPYSIINRAKLIIAGNALPDSNDTSHGFFRRFAVVPFNRLFTEEEMDHDIDNKLKAERAGILNMLLAAYGEMKKRGRLSTSTAGLARLEEYKISNDPILQWSKSWLEIRNAPFDENIFTTNVDLYANYLKFCIEDGIKAVAKEKLLVRLRAIVPDWENRKHRKEFARGRLGVQILNEAKSPF